MLSLSASDHQTFQLDWIDSPEGQSVCQRIRQIFPLSPDASIRRALRRSLKRHTADPGNDFLVLDVIQRLSSFDEAN